LTDATTTGGVTATTTYTYAGNTGSSYADPDASTQVGNAALSYDKNGNLTTGQGGLSLAWDWRNRLSISTSSVQTINYAYDENDKRVRVVTATTYYHYPNDLYSYDFTSNLPVKQVFANGHEIATVNGATGSGVVDYDFTDNLGSIAAVADPSNRVQEITDYTPFGSMNNHDQLAGYTELRKYDGKPFDTDTGVNAGEKMYQRAGVKLHHGEMPTAPTGRLLRRDKQNEKRIAFPANVPERRALPHQACSLTQSILRPAPAPLLNPKINAY